MNGSTVATEAHTVGSTLRAWGHDTAEALDDVALIAALQRRDEAAFRSVVTQYHPALIRAARSFVRNAASAEEAAQETWLAVIRGVGSFEGRSSFKTWLFRILVNQAMSSGKREARVVVDGTQLGNDDPGTNAARFHGADHRLPDHWRSAPTDWGLLPEAHLYSAETVLEIELAISTLPELQQQVITMRDVCSLTAVEVCEILDLRDVNQRVLLHRARSQVRAVLEAHLERAAAAS